MDPVREACRPAGLLASGSSAAGSFPDAQPALPISRVQWIAARGVPGDSGGGRAGFSPASLRRTIQRAPKRTNHNASLFRVQPAHRMRTKCAAPTTRSISTACVGSGFRRSCSRPESPPRRSSRSAGSSRGRTTCSSRGSRPKPGKKSRAHLSRAEPNTTRAPRRSTSPSESRCRGWRGSSPSSRRARPTLPSPKRRGNRSSISASNRRSCPTSAWRASCGSSRASRRSSAPTSSSRWREWKRRFSRSSAASSAGRSWPCPPRPATAPRSRASPLSSPPSTPARTGSRR